MADKETFQKEIRAKLKEWSKIIDALRALREEKLESGSEDLVAHCDKMHMIYNKYLEARQELKKLAKKNNASW